jgi:hypothetical protein
MTTAVCFGRYLKGCAVVSDKEAVQYGIYCIDILPLWMERMCFRILNSCPEEYFILNMRTHYS